MARRRERCRVEKLWLEAGRQLSTLSGCSAIGRGSPTTDLLNLNTDSAHSPYEVLYTIAALWCQSLNTVFLPVEISSNNLLLGTAIWIPNFYFEHFDNMFAWCLSNVSIALGTLLIFS